MILVYEASTYMRLIDESMVYEAGRQSWCVRLVY
jgi:hypothetical protein